MDIYRKEMNTGTTFHNTYNHPVGKKTADFTYYINRLISLNLTQRIIKGRTNILHMAKNNVISTEEIIHIEKQQSKKSKGISYINKSKTWETFTYYRGFKRNITNILKKQHNKNSIQDRQQHIQLIAIRETNKWKNNWHIHTYRQHI